VFTSELDNPIDRQFSNAELEVMVEEANRAQRIVAAHCHGKLGIVAALNAGCHTIKHGTYLDEEAIALMKEKGVMLIATRTIIERGNETDRSLSGAYTRRGSFGGPTR